MKRLRSSFRDPSGHVYYDKGTLLRQINSSYREQYDRLIKSGLYDELVADGLLIEHQEVSTSAAEGVYKTIQPTRIPFISYPYEWSFGQLKDAALATLKIQQRALQHDLILKDASAYNIQFFKGRPLLIDTLSFEIYHEGQPWMGYRQFCQHFLAPLALMSRRDPRLHQLLRAYLDGLPLDLASALLPKTTWFNIGLLTHLHLHAKSQLHFANHKQSQQVRSRWLTRASHQALAANLIKTIRRLQRKRLSTEWAEYYSDDSYTPTAFESKKEIIEDFITRAQPQVVWDLGANTGEFSKIAARLGCNTIAFDIDELAVEKNYRDVRRTKEQNILPLILDLANPSADIGFAHQERDSLRSRGRADLLLALALIHHLAITFRLPLPDIAEYFAEIGSKVVIEFVPRTDPKAKRLLMTAADTFPQYSQSAFEDAFRRFFTFSSPMQIKDSQRLLYYMTRI